MKANLLVHKLTDQRKKIGLCYINCHRKSPWQLAYVFLRKNPRKSNRGNMSGGPRDVAAVMVGAMVDMT